MFTEYKSLEWHEVSAISCRSCNRETLLRRTYSSVPDMEDQTNHTCTWNVVEPLQMYPVLLREPKPHAEMPRKVAAIFNQARHVAPVSPPAAAALLRAGLEVLLKGDPFNEPPKDTLFKCVESVAERTELRDLWQGMEVVRIVGNEAAHTAVLDLTIDSEDVDVLFLFLNEIVERSIAGPNKRLAFFDQLPENKKRDLSSD